MSDLSITVCGIRIDTIAVILVGLTILLIQKFKVNPMLVLVIIGCIGAVIGV